MKNKHSGKKNIFMIVRRRFNNCKSTNLQEELGNLFSPWIKKLSCTKLEQERKVPDEGSGSINSCVN